MRKKGEITVFLSLVLTIMIALLFQVIETARTNGVRFMTECASDMALQSVLAEYNRELLRQYDLFFIDSAYGSTASDSRLLENHLLNYMNENLSYGALSQKLICDFYDAGCESAIVTKTCCASDRLGEIVEREAVDYMLDLYGLNHIPLFEKEREKVDTERLLDGNVEEKRLDNQAKIEAFRKKKRKKLEDFSIENPADAVNDQRSPGILVSKVTGADGISQGNCIGEDVLSEREYEEKEGFLQNEKEANQLEDLIFQRYLIQKCGNYVDRKDNSHLAYELEYIISGNKSDRENLESVVQKLVLLRDAADFAYLMTDSGKCAEAEALADTIAAVILFPELGPLIKMSILFAWSYAEAVNDVRILLSGGRVALLKNSTQWKLGMFDGLRMKTPGGENAEGLAYHEYLQTLLYFINREERNMRFLDIVELDVRKASGDSNFKMNMCIHDFEAILYVKSKRGHRINITRLVGYQK